MNNKSTSLTRPGRPPIRESAAESYIHMRIEITKKAAWVKSAKQRGQKLSQFVIDACDKAVDKPVER